MRFLTAPILALTVLALAQVAGAGWEDDLDSLIEAPEGAERDALLERVAAAAPDWRDVASRIDDLTFAAPPRKGVPILRSAVCTDTVERPWVLLLPPAYDPTEPAPLLVVLHGGVSAGEITDDPLGYAEENRLADLAAARGWITIFPFGQEGATWWDEVGMANIKKLVRTVKPEQNVDDDRVWMAGFSDGASAGFAHAMVAPDDYAAFVTLNGHIGVGSLDGDLPTYAPNLANTPIYATTTFDDGLYPSARMGATIGMARRAGADIFYREMAGEHDFDDVADELPGIGRFLDRHPRDPFPTRIVWESVGREFGRCRWFSIDEVTIEDPEPWHADWNAALVSDRLTVGFVPDYEVEEGGVLVSSVPDADTPAGLMGLGAGDTIVEADDMTIDTLDDFNKWKGTVARGDAFDLTIEREGRRVTLHGRFPEPENYFVFKREAPSGLARASYSANRVDVETSRVGAFSVFIHPDMFRLDENVVIAVNGEVMWGNEEGPVTCGPLLRVLFGSPTARRPSTPRGAAGEDREDRLGQILVLLDRVVDLRRDAEQARRSRRTLEHRHFDPVLVPQDLLDGIEREHRRRERVSAHPHRDARERPDHLVGAGRGHAEGITENGAGRKRQGAVPLHQRRPPTRQERPHEADRVRNAEVRARVVRSRPVELEAEA